MSSTYQPQGWDRAGFVGPDMYTNRTRICLPLCSLMSTRRFSKSVSITPLGLVPTHVFVASWKESTVFQSSCPGGVEPVVSAICTWAESSLSFRKNDQ